MLKILMKIIYYSVGMSGDIAQSRHNYLLDSYTLSQILGKNDLVVVVVT